MSEEFGGFNPFEEVKSEPSDAHEAPEVAKKAESENAETTRQQEVKAQDQAKIDEAEIEEAYTNLNEDLLDVEDEDTWWMIQRIGLGILKIAGVLGILFLIFWSIWGDSPVEKKVKNIADLPNSKIAKKIEQKLPPKSAEGLWEKLFGGASEEEQKTEKVAKKTEEKPGPPQKNLPEKAEKSWWENLFGGKDEKTENPAKKSSKPPQESPKIDPEIPAVSETAKQEFLKNQPHQGVLSVMSWSYWLENKRMLEQHQTLGKTVLWIKSTEALFDIPLKDHISGENETTRQYQYFKLFKNNQDLLNKAEKIQQNLQQEIKEFRGKEAFYQTRASEASQNFMTALNNSDPSQIDTLLAEKIQTEKLQVSNGIEANSREILLKKVRGYQQVLQNVDSYLTANKKALILGVQTVAFPEDPFGVVIPLKAWEAQQQSKK